MSVRLRDGSALRGLLRSQGKHDLQLQTLDGQLRLLLDTEYREISREKGSFMPALKATPEERRDLLAYLSRLDGVPAGPLQRRAASDSGRGDRPDSESEARRMAHLQRRCSARIAIAR